MNALDTNILVYAFDAADLKKHKRAKQLVLAAFSGEKPVSVTTQVLAEFAVVARTKLNPPLSTEEIELFIRSVEKSPHWKVYSYSPANICAALQHKAFWDGLIAETLGGGTLFTENVAHFKGTPLSAKNPFL